MSVRGSQPGLAEAFLHPSVGRNLRLEAIATRIDWRAVEASLRSLRSGERGAPPYPALTMVKALLLQQWYGLSDTGLEEALLDRMSFRRFVGLSGDEAAPDHSTLWRFRQALGRHGLDKTVLEAVNGQLDAQGLIVRQGTLIDASLIAAQSHPPGPAAAEQVEPGASRLIRTPREPDADWTKRGAARFFGYKAHASASSIAGRAWSAASCSPPGQRQRTPSSPTISSSAMNERCGPTRSPTTATPDAPGWRWRGSRTASAGAATSTIGPRSGPSAAIGPSPGCAAASRRCSPSSSVTTDMTERATSPCHAQSHRPSPRLAPPSTFRRSPPAGRHDNPGQPAPPNPLSNRRPRAHDCQQFKSKPKGSFRKAPVFGGGGGVLRRRRGRATRPLSPISDHDLNSADIPTGARPLRRGIPRLVIWPRAAKSRLPRRRGRGRFLGQESHLSEPVPAVLMA